MEHEIEPVNGADELPLKKHPELSPDMRRIDGARPKFRQARMRMAHGSFKIKSIDRFSVFQ